MWSDHAAVITCTLRLHPAPWLALILPVWLPGFDVMLIVPRRRAA